MNKNNADLYVGRRIRERRLLLGLCLKELAGTLGLSYQQFYKYEQGINRVSAGRLYDIAKVLQVEISYFYEGLDKGNGTFEGVEHIPQVAHIAKQLSHLDDPADRRLLCRLADALVEKERDAKV